MTTHQNPSRKKVAGPLCAFGAHRTPKNQSVTPSMSIASSIVPSLNGRPSEVKTQNLTRLYTPLYKKSNSYKHMHQINKTPSPH